MFPQAPCLIGYNIGLVAFVWLCVFSNVFSNYLPKFMQSHIDCICLTFPPYVFKCLLKWHASKYAYSHWLHMFDFSWLCFQKSPQIVWVRACKRTLIAIVSLSTVLNQMLLQIASFVFFSCFFKVLASEDALPVIICHNNGTCRTSFQLCF